MSQLIDICGTPIALEKIRNFRLVKRDFLFYPAYQEVATMSFSLFARMGDSNKKKFEFVQMVPFGTLLGDKEKPALGGYEIKSFNEALTFSLIEDAKNALGNVAGLAADFLRIDTSGNKQFTILTTGRRLVKLKMRDIPARVSFLTGKVSDVYKNDPIYSFLGEPIAPVIGSVQALIVTVDKSNYVFFGNGIDVEDIETVYYSLLDAYNQLQSAQDNIKPRLASPKVTLRFPKVKLPFLKLSSPSPADSVEVSADGSNTVDNVSEKSI